jgi:hypothetical protein
MAVVGALLFILFVLLLYGCLFIFSFWSKIMPMLIHFITLLSFCLYISLFLSRRDFCIQASYVNGGVPLPAPAPVPAPVPDPVPVPVLPAPEDSTTIAAIGFNGSPSEVYPLGLCQGDCDSDSDCADNLVCFQRGPNESVPGCSGGESGNTDDDYCVLPSGEVNNDDADNDNLVPNEISNDERPVDTTSSFRLKKYWEPGYFWQEETVEREWCAMYRYDGPQGDGYCWYGKERRRCRDEQLYIDRCRDSSRQQFRFVQYSNGEVQIRAADENRCLEMVGDELYMRGCDERNSMQRWFSPNGDFNGRRFELSHRSRVRAVLST